MTDQSNSQIGIHFSVVRLAERDHVDLIERGNQGPDNGVKTGGFVGEAHVRPCRNLGRLSTKGRNWKDGHRGDRAQGDSAND
jgi:hypothetical protein